MRLIPVTSNYSEKSTNQSAVWRDLVAALEQVDVAWKATHPTGTGTAASSQLPGNVAVALVKDAYQATEAIIGVSKWPTR
ncbi:hypothetical protein ALI144C_02555 [Actinosynnema sp. ALI-1.44]|nr:hypothetical protein ALI144C_02555 [Actinosynnema sp. ALI-1.44]